MPRLPRFLLIALVVGCLAPFAPSRSDAGKLADDGRAGEISDVQGTALVRPPDRLRWTPLARRDLLLPGDIVRTAPRGAHALEVRMGTAALLLGPGTTIEMKSPTAIHLKQGVLEVKTTDKHPITVSGGGDFRQEVKGTLWAQSDARTAKALPKIPKWIQSYRASTSDEWMGALVANVDGREVNLAVGSYSVVTEIKDQIARTTIEQAFVNSTKWRLEGVFYFPLPAGASISGFGMWIGDELVEADVVERQRARQIYEDILRRKKDPGLLEWEGGNLFKARVFPIEAFSNKRIRIRYTQALPLEGRTFRYTHALRSDLLRAKPLREMNIVVRVDASAGIEMVSSPTHDVQIQKTETTAEVRFSAQEFTPERDLEITVRLKKAAPLTLLPHRRGEDGYFLMQFTPPGADAGGWQRELVPEGDPLEIVAVVDTSGSMDEAARRKQEEFLTSMAQLLGPKDRLRILAYDVAPVWIAKEAIPGDSDAFVEALDTLRARRSLGWSDVDAAMAEAATVKPKNGFVLYLGDGIGTTDDADPVALADRMRNAHKGMSIHAVAPSSTYEAPVLEALASLGGGTVREVGANPAQTAAKLLGEAMRPLVRNLNVTIEGIRTARIYPDTLPNLPVGMQQSVLGRFLPADKAQEAVVVINGTLDGKPITYRTNVTVPATDGGNSFLPRLWGRKHIDALLAQGSSKEIKAEIVEFSERFGIMTPLTSFLVLESDEDRERYGVERRVHMRDGERFFAEARDHVALEARRDAVRKAAGWRTRQRVEVLRELARLGRDLPIPMPLHYPGVGVTGGGGGAFGAKGKLGSLRAETRSAMNAKGRRRGSESGGDDWGGVPEPASPMAPMDAVAESKSSDLDAETENDDVFGQSDSVDEYEDQDLAPSAELKADKQMNKKSERGLSRKDRRQSSGYAPARDGGGFYRLEQRRNHAPWHQPLPRPTLTALGFPPLPPPFELPERDTGADSWSPQVRTLLRSLERRDDMTSPEHGMHVRILTKSVHPQRDLVTNASLLEAWVGPQSWRMRRRGNGGATPLEAWTVDNLRGTLDTAHRLARRRPAAKLDPQAWSLPIWDLHTKSALHTWRDQGYIPRITSQTATEVVVTLTHQNPAAKQFTRVLVIDPARRIVRESRVVQPDGTVTHVTKYSDHIEVAGRHYPKTITIASGDPLRVTQTMTLAWNALTRPSLTAAMAPVRNLAPDVWLVEGTLPTVIAAKQARHDAKASMLDLLTLTIDSAHRQQWDAAWSTWAPVTEAVGPDRFGDDWVELWLLHKARAGEKTKAHAMALVQQTLAAKGLDALTLARNLVSHIGASLGANEALALHNAVESAWTQAGESFAPDVAAARRYDWMRRKSQALDRAGKSLEGSALRATLASENTFHLGDQVAYIRDLWNQGEYDTGIDHLVMLLRDREPWSDNERNTIYRTLLDYLWQRRLFDALHSTAVAWTEVAPSLHEAHWRRVSALFYLGRDEQADTWIHAQLALRPNVDADATVRAKLQAAVQVARGDGWNFNIRSMLPEDANRLKALALHLSAAETPKAPWARSLAQTIRNDYRFRRTDAARVLTEALRETLTAPSAIATMELGRLQWLSNALPWQRNQVTTEEWRAVVDAVRARWAQTEDKQAVSQLAMIVTRLLDAHQEQREAIEFVRAQLSRIEELAHKTQAREDLVRRLMALAAGTADEQAEIAQLVRLILEADELVDHRRARAAEFARQIASRFFTWHYDVALGSPEDLEKLTRAERKDANKSARAKARVALRTQLGELIESGASVSKIWLHLEQITYALELGENLPDWTAKAQGLLDRDWKRDDDALNHLLRERAAIALAYAAARGNAPATLRDAVVARLHAGLTSAPTGPDAKPLLAWRHHLWRLLMALDRAEALGEMLRSAIVPSKVDSVWRIRLGYLEAELGHLDAAIAQFNAAHKVGELETIDLEFLATLHLVQGNDKERNAALEAALARRPDYQINNTLWQATRRLSRRGDGVVAELEPETLQLARVLIRKASHPANFLGTVVNLYRTTKDFRVLEAMAGGIPGHTKEALYAFLNQFQQITNEIHEEATCDALAKQLTSLIATSDSAVDRRGMYLALARVRARAAQVLEKDSTHATEALVALQAVRKDSYVAGEPALIAQYFAQMEVIQDAAFAMELRSQVRDLFDQTPITDRARAPIGLALAQIEWKYNNRDEALAHLSMLIDEIRSQHGKGRLVTAQDRQLLSTYVSWLTSIKRYRVAESALRQELGAWKQAERKRVLRLDMYRLYVAAILGNGATSRGQGRALFDAVTTDIEQDLSREPQQAYQYVDLLCDLVDQVHKRKLLAGMPAFVETLISQRAPAILRRIPLSSAQLAHRIGQTTMRTISALRGLRFLLDAYDATQRFVRRIDRDVWTQNMDRYAEMRALAISIGDLEPRLWALVEMQIEKNLRANNMWRGNTFYNKGNRWFWGAREQNMADVAHAIAELEAPRPRIVMAAAQMLWGPLRRRSEGIDVLRAAYDRGHLESAGRNQLATWYFQARRFQAGIPIAAELVEESKDGLAFRTLLARLQFGASRKDDGLATLKATEARWKQEKHWAANVAAALGELAASNGLGEPGVAWMEEALRMRREARGNRGGADSVAARWYGQLAEGLMHLKRYEQALSAATASLVATTTRNRHQRDQAIGRIRRVVENASDLDAFAKAYDADVEKTGVDAVVLRMQFAGVYAERKQFDQAIHHLLAARELDPRDASVHTALVRAYDGAGNGTGAVTALLDSIRLAPHVLASYEDLAARYARAGDALEAERARTTLVEHTPHQMEGHDRLAKIRVELGQPKRALVQSKQVVRTAPLNPVGWLQLADAQVRVGDSAGARKALEHVVATEWEAHYGDVKKRAAAHLARLK